jgi:integrase
MGGPVFLPSVDKERRIIAMAVFQLKDKDGKKSGPWYAKYPIGRLPNNKIHYQQRKIGYSKKLTKRVEAKKYEEFKHRELLGINYETPIRKTFGELVDWYLELEIVKARKSYNDIRRMALLLRDRFDDRLANEIKPSDVENFQIERQKEKAGGKQSMVTSGSVNREVAILRRIFNLAMREELVRRNPCWKVEQLKENNRRERVLSMAEFERLMSHLPEHAADLTMVGYYTGCRASELFDLTWDRVDVGKGCFYLESDDTKNEEPRIIWLLCDEVREVFERRGRVRHISHDYVFHYKNRPIKSIKRSFRRACEKAGIPYGLKVRDGVTFHTLRHTFNDNMRKAGVERTVIKSLTGHKSDSMFERYSHCDQNDAQGAYLKLKDFLEISKIVQNEQEKVLEA